MFRFSLCPLAPEFANKAQSGQRYPRSGYGWTYLFTGRKRRFWTRGVLIETSERSRASNYRSRYGAILDQINTEKCRARNEKFDVNDVRTDDTRKIWFTCSKCGEAYLRTMKGRIHYGKGCYRKCDANSVALHPGAVSLKEVAEGKSLLPAAAASKTTSSNSSNSVAATVLDRIELYTEAGSKERLGADVAAWSEGKYKVKCADCDAVFVNYVRAMTGAKLPGSLDTSDTVEIQNRCGVCRHKFLMKQAVNSMVKTAPTVAAQQQGQQQQQQILGYYGGLNFS